jgi:hypothetical protein
VEEERRMASKKGQRLVNDSQAEYESQPIFNQAESAGRQYGDALCEQRLVNGNELGNIDHRILW